MSFSRLTPMLRTNAVRPLLSAAPRARIQVRFATQDYGSGQGNPAGEKPQQQGKNPSEDLEHPGPPAPKVGQGKSSSPNEKSRSSSSSESRGSEGKNSSSGSGSKGVKGAQPKILNENPPAEDDEGVRQHNEEFEQRAERAHERIRNEDAEKDKVPKGFWSGQGGQDKSA